MDETKTKVQMNLWDGGGSFLEDCLKKTFS